MTKQSFEDFLAEHVLVIPVTLPPPKKAEPEPEEVEA